LYLYVVVEGVGKLSWLTDVVVVVDVFAGYDLTPSKKEGSY
jgi:hypothetical protein